MQANNYTTTGLSKINRGLFSTVYKLNDKQVLIKSVDKAKECYSSVEVGDLFPTMDKVDRGTYVMDYLKAESLSSLRPRYRRLYDDLNYMFDNAELWKCKSYDRRYYHWRDKFKKHVRDADFLEQMLEMLDEMANYGTDVTFEIERRNVRVKNGRLILLDCFFFTYQMLEVRRQKCYW